MPAYYVCFLDAEFGLGYLRIPTWAPFRLQAYCNGHDWLERQLKAGRVLRIECTASDISSFTRYRQVEPRRSGGRKAPAGSPAASKPAPMRKTPYSLPALAAAMQACNQHYLACISQWPGRTAERHERRAVTTSVRDEKDRSHRGVNFF